jgi:hypothetical protein
VASGLALEAEAVVAAAAPAASLLGSDQLLGLLDSASGTFAQWSSGVAVANSAAVLLLELALLGKMIQRGSGKNANTV